MASVDPILGDSAKTDWNGYFVKGNLLSARPRYVLEQWGERGLRDVFDRLDPKTRGVLEAPILPFQWYSFETLATVDAAIIRGPMRQDFEQMRRFGAAVARYDLSTVYKVLFKLGTPSFIIKRVGTVYGAYVRGGTMSASEVQSGSAVVTLTQGSLPLYFCRYGVSGWFTAGLELSGATSVRVRETRCVHDGGTVCRWEATWT